MRIVDVRAAGLRGRTPAGGWTNELGPDDVVHTLIAVHTDEGQVGIGSSFTSEALVLGALELLRPLLIGASAHDPARVTEDLHQHTFWQGRGGAVTHAISGIDIALWDLLGQAAGLPVARLLGGMYRNEVCPYASVLVDEPARLSRKLAKLQHDGFTAFKIGWGHFGRESAVRDREIVSAARDAIGPDALLAVDAGGSDAYWHQGLKWARDTSEMLHEYGVAWFEEPLNPDDYDGLEALTATSPVPISGGEVLTRRQSYKPYFDRHLVDIVQPDVTKVGGISEFRRIANAAEDASVKVIPHGWNTAVGLAADLQLAAALPHVELVEYCTGSAYIDDVVQTPWTMNESGRLEVPAEAGLGICLDRDKLLFYTGGIDLFSVR